MVTEMKDEDESVKSGEEGRKKETAELGNQRGIYSLPEEEGMILSKA
jgi:hypothetical protein